jgi:y4mF family transcriptional regulator
LGFPIGNNLALLFDNLPNIPDRELSGLHWIEHSIIFPFGKIEMTAEQIGTAVRSARREQGLTQDQLAAAAGVGVRFLIELERGKPTVQLGKTLAVLAALGCRVAITPPGPMPDHTP